MTMYQTDNLRIQGIKEVAAPSQVHDAFPITETAAQTVHDARESVHNILHGADDRIVIIVGPCSVHDPEAAMEYAGKRRHSYLNYDAPLQYEKMMACA